MYCREETASEYTMLLTDEIGVYIGEISVEDFQEALESKEVLIEDDYIYYKLNKNKILKSIIK